MRSGVLCGREHVGVGRIACIAEGTTAIALSQGGAGKTYAYKSPNEDAAAFALGEGGCLLAVADGHSGHEASEIAVAELLAAYGEDWTGSSPASQPWPARAAQAVEHAHRAMLARAPQVGGLEARTTLAFTLARPHEDWLGWASVGDSHVFVVEEAAASERGGTADGPSFLGSPSASAEALAVRSGSEALAGSRAIVLATDGLSERGIGVASPASAVLAAAARGASLQPALRALETARALVETALEAHRHHRSGDNIATAVYWCGA